MAYTVKNFKSKKALVESFNLGNKTKVFQPGPFGPKVEDGYAVIEGPHFPQPHRWCCEVMVKNGYVVKIVK